MPYLCKFDPTEPQNTHLKIFHGNQIDQTCFFQTLCKYHESKYAKVIDLFDVDTLGHNSMTKLTYPKTSIKII